MRMSCNGCRVLRKGCSENCSIRPCLQWIKSPESQANATVFLAKFYGRAGLMNLINGGPENLRPAIFRSLLYEACGRIVNPIYGSVGLLWSGSWQLCQSAVESVLNGSAIIPISTESALSPSPPMKAYDIRHISKAENSAVSQELHKVKTSRNRFKRWGSKPKPKIDSVLPVGQDSDTWHRCYPDGFNRAASNDLSETATEPNGDGDSRETESVFSVETEEGTLVNRDGSEPVQKPGNKADYDSEVELELTLGFEPVSRKHGVCPMKGLSEMCGSDDDTWKMKLGF